MHGSLRRLGRWLLVDFDRPGALRPPKLVFAASTILAAIAASLPALLLPLPSLVHLALAIPISVATMIAALLVATTSLARYRFMRTGRPELAIGRLVAVYVLGSLGLIAGSAGYAFAF
jgi:hypothetical protein